MALLGINLVLGPEELLAVLDGRAREANVATDTRTHERHLGAATVLLGEVRALHGGVAGGGRELLQLEPVHPICSDEGKENEGCET